MKKNGKVIVLIFSSVILLILLLLIALRTGTNEDKILEIRETLFIQQVSDVHVNTDEYLGKTVKLEGIYGENPNSGGGEPQRFVYRNSPGCCGNDGVVGFVVLLGDCPAPKPNAWVEATGKVDVIASGKNARVKPVVLRLSSLTVMDRRGKEFVSK